MTMACLAIHLLVTTLLMHATSGQDDAARPPLPQLEVFADILHSGAVISAAKKQGQKELTGAIQELRNVQDTAGEVAIAVQPLEDQFGLDGSFDGVQKELGELIGKAASGGSSDEKKAAQTLEAVKAHLDKVMKKSRDVGGGKITTSSGSGPDSGGRGSSAKPQPPQGHLAAGGDGGDSSAFHANGTERPGLPGGDADWISALPGPGTSFSPPLPPRNKCSSCKMGVLIVASAVVFGSIGLVYRNIKYVGDNYMSNHSSSAGGGGGSDLMPGDPNQPPPSGDESLTRGPGFGTMGILMTTIPGLALLALGSYFLYRCLGRDGSSTMRDEEAKTTSATTITKQKSPSGRSSKSKSKSKSRSPKTGRTKSPGRSGSPGKSGSPSGASKKKSKSPKTGKTKSPGSKSPSGGSKKSKSPSGGGRASKKDVTASSSKAASSTGSK